MNKKKEELVGIPPGDKFGKKILEELDWQNVLSIGGYFLIFILTTTQGAFSSETAGWKSWNLLTVIWKLLNGILHSNLILG